LVHDHSSHLSVKLDDILSRCRCGDADGVCDNMDNLYQDIVNILVAGANLFVPVRRKCFFTFWWDEELDILKEAAVDSHRLWKASGKPRYGPIFDKRQQARLQYRKRIRQGKRFNDEMYTNELHDALLKKDGAGFWKCWRSKFQPANKSVL